MLKIHFDNDSNFAVSRRNSVGLTSIFREVQGKGKNADQVSVFSSPELKAQVSYSDRLLSVVRLSVCLSVCPSVCKLLHFQLLLQNHLANFNQTWHKSSLGGGDSSLLT
jgi:hypothetical protein